MVNLTKWLVVVTIAASLVGLAAILLGLTWKQKEMPDMTEGNTGSLSTIPALDSAAPADTETATFALG